MRKRVWDFYNVCKDIADKLRAKRWLLFLVLLGFGTVAMLVLLPQFNMMPDDANTDFQGGSIIPYLNSIIQKYGEGQYSSYMPARVNILNKIYSQLCGNQPHQTLIGNYHGQLYYIILAYIARALGYADPTRAYLLVQVVACCSLLLAYPFLTYMLTRSITLSAASPWLMTLVSWDYLFAAKNDSYWCAAWVTLLIVPLLVVLISRKWDKRSLIITIFSALAIGIGNIPRNHAAIGVVAPFLAIVIYKLVRYFKENSSTRGRVLGQLRTVCCILLITVLILGSYLYIEPLGKKLYDATDGTVSLAFNEQPWHSLYIGLGGTSNPYGIRYSDRCGMERVQELTPGVSMYSDDYFDVLKSEYLRIVRTDPGFVFTSYLKKFVICVGASLLYNYVRPIYLIVLFPLALLVFLIFRKRSDIVMRNFRRYFPFFVISVLSIFLGTVHSVITKPNPEYILGSFAGNTLCVLCCVFFLVSVLLNLAQEKSSRYRQ